MQRAHTAFLPSTIACHASTSSIATGTAARHSAPRCHGRRSLRPGTALRGARDRVRIGDDIADQAERVAEHVAHEVRDRHPERLRALSQLGLEATRGRACGSRDLCSRARRWVGVFVSRRDTSCITTCHIARAPCPLGVRSPGNGCDRSHRQHAVDRAEARRAWPAESRVREVRAPQSGRIDQGPHRACVDPRCRSARRAGAAFGSADDDRRRHCR